MLRRMMPGMDPARLKSQRRVRVFISVPNGSPSTGTKTQLAPRRTLLATVRTHATFATNIRLHQASRAASRALSRISKDVCSEARTHHIGSVA